MPHPPEADPYFDPLATIELGQVKMVSLQDARRGTYTPC
jgi:hypothetical protein